MDSEYYYKTKRKGEDNMNCFETLKERGYIYQVTHEEEVRKILNGKPITFYLGIDPTADSIHIGHFFALSMARWLQDFGHEAIILVGGATALIGDPTGKSDMRTMITKEEVLKNRKEVRKLIKRFVKKGTLIVDNASWFKGRDYVDFMREVGVHFNVNKMLATEGYKKRLETGGLTFLEMGYMLMQAFDFIYLKEKNNCILQIGGSDQWSNIVAGVELGRKLEFHDNQEIGELYGLTCPLLVKADGEKMGKTAKGTLWVSREKTDSYDFYQAFMNTFDEDVERLLSFFTKMEITTIKKLCKDNIIEAKKIMAFEVTKLVHGKKEAERVRKLSKKIFNDKEIPKDMSTFKLEDFKDINIIDLLLLTKIVSSKSEAKRLIEQNGIMLNKEKIKDIDMIIKEDNFINDELLIQKGKKTFLKVTKNCL